MAELVLYSWPSISLILFAALGRERGLIWSVVVGYLFLPELEGMDLPGLPPYNKQLSISLGISIGAVFLWMKPSWSDDPEILSRRPLDPVAGFKDIWARVLDLDPKEIPIDRSFRALGGTQRQEQLVMRRMLALDIDPEIVWGVMHGQSIAELAGALPRKQWQLLDNRLLLPFLFLLLICLTAAAVMTMRDNLYPLIDADRVRSGMSFRDVISMIGGTVIALVPFLLALKWLRTPRHHEEVLRAIAIMGIFYAFLALIEIRLSPQLNNWIYGFFPHDWRQHVRGGAFRPVVFLGHGLSLAFFLLMAILAAFALYRQLGEQKRHYYALAGIFIFGVLTISSNLGALMLAVIFIPLVLFASWRLQVWAATGAAILFLSWPMVVQYHVLPLDRFVAVVERISTARAQSLQWRLDNEADLLLRVEQKPLWGWGSWGRWRVIDEKGRDTTTVDGIWIIILGERGWVGYICYFGILTLPLLLLPRSARRKEISHATCAMALIMGANLIYMIPNSTLSPTGWLTIGAVAGAVRWRVELPPITDSDGPAAPVSRYTRFARRHSRLAAKSLRRS